MKKTYLLLPVLILITTLSMADIKGDSPGQKKLRAEMVLDQIQRRGVSDKKVLDAMNQVPRHLFVPKKLIRRAYADHPLPIGEGQTISQPYIVALMTETLTLTEKNRVLEIGTGSGYQAAILSKIAKEVFTIEIKEKLHKPPQKFFNHLISTQSKPATGTVTSAGPKPHLLTVL